MSSLRKDIDFSLLDLVNIFRRRAWLILGVTLFAGLLGFCASFLITPRYRATATLLPGRSDVVSSYKLSREKGSFRRSFRMGNVTKRNSHNLEIMASHRVQSTMVEDLGLAKFFGIVEEDSALALAKSIDRLRRATHFELSFQIQILFTHVTTGDPQMSARIANHYLELLQVVNLERYHRYADQKVRFLDEHLVVLEEEILNAEREKSRFLTKHGLVHFDTERDQILALTQRVRGGLLEKQLDCERLALDLASDSPRLLALQAERDVYSHMLATLEGESEERDSASPISGLPPGKSTELEQTLARLDRGLETLRQLEIALVQERESARLQTSIDVETFTVLDRAHAPAEPDWPRRKLITLLMATIALLIVCFSLFGLEALKTLGDGSASSGFRRLLEES